MMESGTLKTAVGAVLCGFGVTCGIVLGPTMGSNAWLIAVAFLIFGFLVVAAPIPRRSK